MQTAYTKHATPVALTLALALVVGGCQNSDKGPARMQYPGIAQLSQGKVPNVKPEDPPQILPNTHFAAGRLFESQGEIGKAIIQYRKTVALNHNHFAAYHRLGRMYSLAGDHVEAINALERATEIKPQNAILHNDLSFEYMFSNRWSDAERSLRKAIELRPAMARSYINLALVQSKQGRFDDAFNTFREVLPEPDAYYNLGLLYRGGGNYVEADRAFRRVLALDDKFTAATTQLAEIAPRLRQMREASAPDKSQTFAMNGKSRDEITEPALPAPSSREMRSDSTAKIASSQSKPTDNVATQIARSIIDKSADIIRQGENGNRPATATGRTFEISEFGQDQVLDREILAAKIENGLQDRLGRQRERQNRRERAMLHDRIRVAYNTDEPFTEGEALEARNSPQTPLRELAEAANALSPDRDMGTEVVTLDELLDIMDNERQCFEDTTFTDVIADWPIIDDAAYSAAAIDGPPADPWAQFMEMQSRLNEKARRVASAIRETPNSETPRRLTMEDRVASSDRSGMANSRPVTPRLMDRDESRRNLAPRKRESKRATPSVMGAAYGPPIAEKAPEPRRYQIRRDQERTVVSRPGFELDWRHGFRRLDALATVITNDVLCAREDQELNALVDEAPIFDPVSPIESDEVGVPSSAIASPIWVEPKRKHKP